MHCWTTCCEVGWLVGQKEVSGWACDGTFLWCYIGPNRPVLFRCWRWCCNVPVVVFWGSDDRTGLAPGGFLKEVCKPGAFFPNVPRSFPSQERRNSVFATLVPARRTSIGTVALDSMLQTRPMHAAVKYSDRSDRSPYVHASCGRDFGFDSDELDLFSIRLLKAPVRLAWDYRDSHHRQ